MSADSAVTYSSVHSEVRSWSIPSKDAYEEAAQQLLEQAPRSPEYVPDSIELEDHVPLHILEHPEDLVPAKDEAPIEAYILEDASATTPPPPPFFYLHRLLLTAPIPGCEAGKSSAAAAKQPGPTMARSVDCCFVDTMETMFRDTERRMMSALEMVNMRVSYQVDVCSRESSVFYSRHHDAQKDRAAVRAEIEAYSRTLEARVAVLETQARRYEWQRQTADDFAIQHIMRTQSLEAGARIDTLEDTGSSSWTRSIADQETTNTTSVTNAQLQAMIDQGVTAALAERDALRSTISDDSHNSKTGARRTERATRECTYTDFLKCQPLHFKGTEGVASLSQWFERMNSVFHISNCAVENQVKFATCTLHSVALTWWNTHELALLYGRMFPEESDKIEKYIGGLPDMIHGSVVASKPKTMQEAVAITTELMDQKIHTFVKREIASKRKFENTLRSTQNQQQQPNKRQNTGRVYTTSSGERKESPAATNNHRNPTCYECGNQGHYRSDFSELKNQDHRNQARGTGAHRMVHALEGGETNQDLNDVEDDINA
nr:hypothetical protein [Tanacetum cinerariifolium]